MFGHTFDKALIATAVVTHILIPAISVGSDPQQGLYSVIGKRFDFSCDTTSVVSFVRKAAHGPHIAALRDPAGDIERPFFIVYEGNEPQGLEWIVPEGLKSASPGQIGKHFVASATSATIEKAFVEPLETADANLQVSMQKNILMIQDRAVVSGMWPLNRVVAECSSNSLTAGDAEKLLRDKYGWNLIDARGKPGAFCKHPEDLVMPQTSGTVTVRDLLLAVLRQASIRAYPQSKGNWVGAFQVQYSSPTSNGERRWTVTVLSGGPPKE